MADKAKHGRIAKGERSGSAKLTEAEVCEIRKAFAAGWMGSDLATRFGVDVGHISNIVTRRKWKHVA